MRRAIGLFTVVTVLCLAGCEWDTTGVEDALNDSCFPLGCGGYSWPAGDDDYDFSVTITPDSLRLEVGETAIVRDTRGHCLRWASRDSTIAHVAAATVAQGVCPASTGGVTALRLGETWVIGSGEFERADSVRVIVE
jgi:hypothetical protein